ncbi:MAG: 2-C-methyl-D-erythritol 4-phosphate cytidylyltransferase [Rhodothermia bacterium]|nr:2-C-methyl-D-erythritol 4-phosphate cytidylyltransferase [Rhodothermia bacterium]
MFPQTSVIIPAGGSGTRLGGLKKQFRLLGGVPLLVQTILVFEACEAVTEVVLVCPKGEEAMAETWREVYGLKKVKKVICGGSTRQESVWNGLNSIHQDAKVVLVHDAVRPFIQAKEVARLVKRIERTGAAALAIPVADTLRRVGEIGFEETVSREELFRMQTPQGFLTNMFRTAHRMAQEQDWEATDDVALVQMAGFMVALEMGSSWNLKITTAEDWAFAEAFWPVWQKMI